MGDEYDEDDEDDEDDEESKIGTVLIDGDLSQGASASWYEGRAEFSGACSASVMAGVDADPGSSTSDVLALPGEPDGPVVNVVQAGGCTALGTLFIGSPEDCRSRMQGLELD